MPGLWGPKRKKQEKLLLDIRTGREKFAPMHVAAAIREKLTAAFAPIALDVQDESARHAGHAGATRDDGSQGETHFHVRIVSESFDGVSRVERQRRVYAALKDELAGPVHALSLTLQAPSDSQQAGR
jgi:BolA protein